MSKYDVAIKNPTFNHLPADAALKKAFENQKDGMTQHVSGTPHLSMENLKHRFFIMNPDGQMVSAERYSTANMLDAALGNRLFMRDSANALRQIGMENEHGEINLTVSDAMKENPPKSPSFWTYIKAWFNNRAAKEEIAAYKGAKTLNDAFCKLTEDARYTIKRNPEPRKIAPEEPAAEKPEVKKAVVQEKPSRNMSGPAFKEYLEKVRTDDLMDLEALSEDVPTVDGYYNALTNILIGQASMQILSNPNTDYAAIQPAYWSMTEHLNGFVRTQVDEGQVKTIVDGINADKSYGNFVQQIDAIRENLLATGLQNYHGQVKAQNEAAKQLSEQPQLQQQMQMDAPAAPEAPKPQVPGL